ncbi:CdaR family protein [Rummeliibacillus sp. BSL5]
MDKLFESPWFLRIMALLLSLLIFFTVKSETSTDNYTTTTSDRQAEVIKDVPVEVLYDSENLIVSDVPKTVDVSIKGPLAVVLQTKAFKDYHVYLDLSKETIGEHKVKFKSKGFSDKLNVQIEPSTINVSIEEKVTKTFKIDPDFNESRLSPNYFIKTMTANPSEVTVTGAKSVIDNIAYIKAMLSSDGNINESFTKDAPVKVLDRDMNKLDVSVTPATVSVKVDIGEYSKEVPLSLNIKGSPKGKKVKSIKAEETMITLFGSKNDLEKIQSLPVDVDVTKLKKSGDISVNLDKPNGVTKLSFNQLRVHVIVDDTSSSSGSDQNQEKEKEDKNADNEETKVTEAPVSTSTVTLNDVAVSIENLDTDQYEIESNANHFVSVLVTGEKQRLANIAKSDIRLYVDAKDVKEGINNLEIMGESPKGTTWKANPNTMKLKISQIS